MSSKNNGSLKKRLLVNFKEFKKHKLVTFIPWRPLAVFAVIWLLILFLVPIFPNTIVKTYPVSFTTQTVQDPNTELGDTQVKQAGAQGSENITYSQHKSLFEFIFGGGTQNKVTEISAVTTKQPTKEIVSAGTKKYQYMYCSNGSYRYYTDKQFKDSNTGFTHSSPDNCAQNNQGKETQLASVPPASATYTPAPISLPELTVPSCNTTSIPYGIDYKNASWLPAGQTQTFAGLNGTFFSCTGATVQPVNEIVYEGTGQDYNAAAQQEAISQAREQCTAEYNSAMAQINAAGAGTSSAVSELAQLYSQCLDRAG